MKLLVKNLHRLKKGSRQIQSTVAAAVLIIFILAGGGLVSITGSGRNPGQASFPSPPADRTLIYLADENNALFALPFEAATTSLRFREVARSDKRGNLDLAGEHSQTVIGRPTPHFYLFVQDMQGVRPPFIVRLTEKDKKRRIGVMLQKGMTGFAVSSEEIIRPRLLVLKREDGMLFMQVSPRDPLPAGEYAFVGADPARIATFRIAAESNR